MLRLQTNLTLKKIHPRGVTLKQYDRLVLTNEIIRNPMRMI